MSLRLGITDLDEVIDSEFDGLYRACEIRHSVPILRLLMQDHQLGHLQQYSIMSILYISHTSHYSYITPPLPPHAR
jgi:hypothetical protein